MDLECFLKKLLHNKKDMTKCDLENESEACSEYSNDYLTEIEFNSYITEDMRDFVDSKF